MNRFGQKLTKEEVDAVPRPSAPYIEPTEILPVPTDAEMATWMPDPAPEQRRFRWEVNVQTGERTAIELTLDEYRQRHVGKIKSKNEHFLRKQEEAAKAAHDADMEAMLVEWQSKKAK